MTIKIRSSPMTNAYRGELELTDSREVHNERRMPNMDIDTRIRGMIESFAGQLAALIRESAMETVRDALGGSGRGKRSAGDRGVSAVSFGALRPKGQKRDPEELSKLRDRLLEFIKTNPGLRIEQIAEGLKTSTRELNLPAKKLISEKLVKTRGQKRATRYFSR